MRQIIALVLLVLFMFGPAYAREIDVPLKITSFNYGGVDVWPRDVIALVVDDTGNIGTYTFSNIPATLVDSTNQDPNDAFYLKGMDTTVTVESISRRVKIFYRIIYYENTSDTDKLGDTYMDPYYPGRGTQRCLFYSKDTSGGTELVSDVKITIRDTNRVYEADKTTSSGAAAFFYLDSSDSYIVNARKSGYYFPEDTIEITSATSYNVYGYDTDSTTLSRVWAYATDLGSNATENVRIWAQLKTSGRVFNSCDSTWVSKYYRESGYTDSDGYVEFYLVKSKCIDSTKYEFFMEEGNTRRKLGIYSVPDQGDWRIGADPES